MHSNQLSEPATLRMIQFLKENPDTDIGWETSGKNKMFPTSERNDILAAEFSSIQIHAKALTE